MNASTFAGSVLALLLVIGIARGAGEAPVQVTVTELHICCGACVKAIQKAAATVEGVRATVDQDEATAVLDAPNYAAAQKAIDEIAEAGFHGKIEDKQVHFKPIKTPDGKVQKLEITHIHNCCPGCSDAIKDALEGVDGVTSNTVKPKQVSFVVEGNFAAADVVKSLEEAGFYVKLK